MSMHKQDYNENNRPNNNIGKFLLFLYITLNGFSLGSMVRIGRGIADNGADKNSIIALLMYLGCTIYTAQRAIQVYKHIHKNDKNNQR